MSKKSEVIRVSKEESRLVTLLREMDKDMLISEIDTAINLQSFPALQTLRAILKSEFIPPFFSLSISRESVRLLETSLNTNTPIVITGEDATNNLVFLKTIINEYKHKLQKVAIVDSTDDLIHSVCLMNSTVYNISDQKDSQSALYNLSIEGVDRLIINRPLYLEDYLLLYSAMQFGIPFIWVSTVHPLEAPMLQVNKKAYDLIRGKFKESSHLHVKYLSEVGEDGFKIQVEEVSIQPLLESSTSQ